MNELAFREAYWADPVARQAFQRFLAEIHGLDLSGWESAGYWDECYRPFSYFDPEGRVASSVCVYSLELIVQGSPCRAAQISGVGTSAARRRQGLNRRLTEIALEWAAPGHDFVFLFANDDAVPFYARCGFLQVEERIARVDVQPGAPRPGLRRLDPDEPSDVKLLSASAELRAPVSDTLGVISPKLFMFHALYRFRDCLYHIRNLDVVVAIERDGPHLTVYDVVGPRVPRFDELCPYLVTPDTTEIEFYFVPDKLEIENPRWRALRGNNLHDRGDIPLRTERFLFPFTAHA